MSVEPSNKQGFLFHNTPNALDGSVILIDENCTWCASCVSSKSSSGGMLCNCPPILDASSRPKVKAVWNVTYLTRVVKSSCRRLKSNCHPTGKRPPSGHFFFRFVAYCNDLILFRTKNRVYSIVSIWNRRKLRSIGGDQAEPKTSMVVSANKSHTKQTICVA